MFANNVLAKRREQCEKNRKETPDWDANGSKANDKELDDHVAMGGELLTRMGFVEYTGVEVIVRILQGEGGSTGSEMEFFEI